MKNNLLLILVAASLYANTPKEPFKVIPKTICENIYEKNLNDFARIDKKKFVVELYTNNCKKGRKFFWIDDNNKLKSNYLDLIGLSAQDELYSNKAKNLIKTKTIALSKDSLQYKEIINLDIELTNIFIKTIYYQYYGNIDFDDMKNAIRQIKKKQDKNNKFEWDYLKKKVELEKYIADALNHDKILSGIINIQTNYIQHKKLKNSIKKYKKIQKMGIWRPIAYGKTIRYNTNDTRIPQIKKRLMHTDGLDLKQNLTPFYDKNFLKAVIQFQLRHGLKPDGNIGKTTIQKLNIPVADKIAQINLNLERHRWLPLNFPNKYIEINIPSFKLRIIEDNTVSYATKVVVGKYKRPTPVFKGRLSSFVINPYWRVPQSIIQRDFVDKMMLDSTYGQRKNIKITRDGVPVASTDINWFEYNEDDNVPYEFTQAPGDNNALGRVKFLFPNRYAVYMHDTNHKSLFKRNTRAYSSGCIRIYKPFKLLDILVEDDKRYTNKNIKEHLKSKQNRHFVFKNKLDIYINYLTVYVDDDGLTYFYPDIYGYDKLQQKWM